MTNRQCLTLNAHAIKAVRIRASVRCCLLTFSQQITLPSTYLRLVLVAVSQCEFTISVVRLALT